MNRGLSVEDYLRAGSTFPLFYKALLDGHATEMLKLFYNITSESELCIEQLNWCGKQVGIEVKVRTLAIGTYMENGFFGLHFPFWRYNWTTSDAQVDFQTPNMQNALQVLCEHHTLRPADFLNMRMVCKGWNQACSRDTLWTNWCKKLKVEPMFDDIASPMRRYVFASMAQHRNGRIHPIGLDQFQKAAKKNTKLYGVLKRKLYGCHVHYRTQKVGLGKRTNFHICRNERSCGDVCNSMFMYLSSKGNLCRVDTEKPMTESDWVYNVVDRILLK